MVKYRVEHPRDRRTYFSPPFPAHDDVVYSAGLIDGEGWIRIKCGNGRQRDRYYVTVAVKMTDEAVIRWLAATWDGSVSGPNQPSNPNGRPSWTWSVTHRILTESVLAQIQPYLKVKATHAVNALALLREPSTRASADYFEIQARLNRRGPVEPVQLKVMGGSE